MARVLLVSQPTDGGVFRHVRDLAEGLPAHGFDVALATPPLQTPAPTGLTVELPLVRAPSPRDDARAVAGLARAVRALRPDIVHAHSSKAGAVARLARRWRRARRSSTPRTATRTPATSRAGAQRRRIRAGRAGADAARIADRLRLRGRAPARPRARRRRARAGRPQRVDLPPDTPVHPEVAALRARGPRHRDGDAAAAGQGHRDAARRAARRARRPPGGAAGDRRHRRRPRRPRGARPRPGRGDAVRFLGFTTDSAAVLRGADVFVSPLMGRVVPLRDPRGDGARRARSSPRVSAASARRCRTASHRTAGARRATPTSLARRSPRSSPIQRRADEMGAARPLGRARRASRASACSRPRRGLHAGVAA